MRKLPSVTKELFGLTPHFTSAELRQAWLRLVQELHPDRWATAGEGVRQMKEAALSGMARSALLLEDTALIFAGCALSKAISGPVTMAAGHRAAMMRKAVHGYDQCMAGDPKSFEGVRDQIMAQIRASLGEH